MKQGEKQGQATESRRENTQNLKLSQFMVVVDWYMQAKVELSHNA